MGNLFAKEGASDPVDQDLDDQGTIECVAQGMGVIVQHGFESINMRLVVELPSAASAELKTIMENGELENTPKLVSSARRLVTYVNDQEFTERGLHKAERNEGYAPYRYGRNNFLQVWPINYNDEFKKRACKDMDGCDLDIRNAGDEELLEEVTRVRKIQETKTASLSSFQSSQQIIEKAKNRAAHMENMVKLVFGVEPISIRFCCTKSNIEELALVGQPDKLMKVLQKKVSKDYFRIQSADGFNLVVDTFQRVDNRIAATKKFIKSSMRFNLGHNTENVVVYWRSGFTSFTCVKTLKQFEFDSWFNKDKVVSVSDFLLEATFPGKPFHENRNQKTSCTVAKWRGNDYVIKKVGLIREVEVLNVLRLHPHPFILHSYCHQADATGCQIVMEKGLYDLEQGVITRKATSDNPCESEQFKQLKTRWLAQVFLGLEHMHRFKEEPVVHRDIKPQNVIIFDDQQGTSRAKITDFGTSRAHELPDQYEGGTVGIKGSNGYMAPEVLNGGGSFVWDKDTGVLADLFSFGAVAYFLFSEEDPPGCDKPNTIEANKNNAIELARKIRSSTKLTSDEKDFVEKLTRLAEDKEKRMRHDAVRGHAVLEQFSLKPYEKSQAYREAAENSIAGKD